MYPMLCDGVKFRTSWEGRSELFFVQNDDGEEFMVSGPVYNALRLCDGTKPLRLPDHGENLLPELKRYGLVRMSRWVNGGLFNRFILFRLSVSDNVDHIYPPNQVRDEVPDITNNAASWDSIT